MKVACHWDGWEYLGLVTHLDSLVPALLVMSANVVTWRKKWQHCAPRSHFEVDAGRFVRASIMNWSCSRCGSSHALSSYFTVSPYLSLNSQRCDVQHLSTYFRIIVPSLLNMSHETPACNCRQSSSTWRLVPTISLFHKWPMRSLFLVEPWSGHSSETDMLA
jgi:hypothetical protein